MNPFIEMYLFEEHLKDIQREAHHVHLQEQALKNKLARPDWFAHTMQSLGQWLIVQGEYLVRRYEVPASGCQSSPC
jgi:hypothetical protein